MKSGSALGTPVIRNVPWLDSFAIGDKRIDEEHRRLLQSCNELCALAADNACARTIQAAARALLIDVEAHFSNEEALFPLIGYHRRLSHMREHLAVGESLNTLLLGHCDLEPAVAASTGRMVLVEHILRHDLAFKTWVLDAIGR